MSETLAAYGAHFLEERNHQGIGNELISPTVPVGHLDGRVACHERLGGLLRFYHRSAA